MSNIITLSDFAITARPVTYNAYGLEYERLPKFYEQVAKTRKMNGYIEEDVRLSSFGRMQRKLDGEAFVMDSMRQEYLTRYIAVEYALGAAVSRRMIEHGKGMDILAKISTELANASVQERNHKVASIFNNAFDSAAQAMGDGAALCTTAAANVSGLSGSNKLAVDADFSEAALETLTIQITSEARNSRGELIVLSPDMLVIHPSNQFEVARILDSSLRAGTADNDKNVHLGELKKRAMSPLLSDSDAWFILTNVNMGSEGLVVKEERPMTIDTEVDFKTSAVLVKGETSFTAGITDRLAVYGSSGG